MAITTIETPQVFTPAYNPMYFYFDSTNKAQLGFRYLVEVVDNDTSEVIGTYRLKPIPTTLYGEVDISDLVQTALYNDFQQTKAYKANGHEINYKLNIDEEYYVNVAFSDYEYAGAANWTNYSDASINPNGFARTQLVHSADPNFNAGDVILVTQTPSANYRPELEGVHTVLDVYNVGAVWYTVLDLLWIGAGSASAGTVSYADGKKTIFTGITTSVFTAFKGAFGFMSFKTYDHTDYDDNDTTCLFLTTLPDEFRISRNKPTRFSYYANNGTGKYVVFNVAGTLYRYAIGAIEDVITVDVLPSDDNITEVYSGGSWIAFGGGLSLDGVTDYTVTIKDSVDGEESVSKLVQLYDECDRFTTYDICFLDRLGSWITVPFNKGSYMTQDVTRQEYRKKYGELTESVWSYEYTDNGKETYHVEEEITYSVNTGILSEVECQYMRELLSTPQAYVSINGGEFQSIRIKSASMPLHLARTTKDRKVNLEFTMSVQDEING